MTTTRGRAMSRFLRGDEEMAKKDDDIRLPSHAPPGQWQSARPLRRQAVARLAAYAFVLFLVVFVLAKAFGAGSTDPYAQGGYARPLSSHEPPGQQRPPKAPGMGNGGGGGVDRGCGKGYSEPVRFPSLAASIHAIAQTDGGQPRNRNVLFAAASLRSVAELLPMACQMAGERESYVHFALLSRSDIPLKELLRMNGIDETCRVIMHDARPDRSLESTETRMALATVRSLYHININMHPQAIIIDSTKAEEAYFLSGMRDGIRSMASALIELPERPSTRFAWITELDSASLAAWNNVHFDILVHASPTGSGNLGRLLRSLSEADLGGVATPHITIELPNAVERSTERLVSKFQWPPTSGGRASTNMLSLRHRIPRQKLTEEESSARFLESFWPVNALYSHVLVLSPHTEVSPQFIHYVKYVLLRHRYARLAPAQVLNARLMGISFSTPSTLLDGSKPLTLPGPSDGSPSASADASFLWQAPTSDAVLFLGNKWVELHGYVSQVLEKQASMSESPALLAHKEVSHKQPSWLELALQLSRIRGYFTLYPGREAADAVVGVHTELKDIPEEYQAAEAEEDAGEGAKEGLRDQASETFDPGSQADVLAGLPAKGALRMLGEFPLLSWDGRQVELGEVEKDAGEYAQRFRREVGQCGDAEGKDAEKDARDLFCKSNTA